MNKKVRAYLIEAARKKDVFVYYSDLVRDCKLDIDIATEFGRKQLSEILGKVSAFENEQQPQRPLLSALAIYKDKNKNDHGDGFYRIAEQLGKGTFQQLKNKLYGFSEADQCRQYWQNDNNYAQFMDEETDNEAPDFFTSEELEVFKRWQYQPYDPNNEEHIEAKDYLMNTVWEKSIYLGREIIKRLDGFELDGKKIWHQRGWKKNEDGENVQAAIFKPYTWVKIFRNNDHGKDIFFTFGIDAYPETEAFVYKIDYQNMRGNKLTQIQIDLCKSLIPASAKWNEISFEELPLKNWKSLIEISVEFINRHLDQYDAIMNAVWGDPIPSIYFKNQLIKREKPQDGFTSNLQPPKKFTGVEIDFLDKAQEQKDLGDAGEALVKQYEINFLNSRGLCKEAALVEIVKDGEGYDVHSFDEYGNDKFIEVKTTTSDKYASFYLSENEVAFMRKNIGSYCIYRIYHYNAENSFGEFFELQNDVENQLLMRPVQFHAVIKKRNKIR